MLHLIHLSVLGGIGVLSLIRAQQIPLGYVASTIHPKQVITSAISDYVEDVMKEAQIPGLSMGVVRLQLGKEPVVELANWGNRTEDDNGADLTSDTLFAIASCSKAFLVTAMGLVMDDYAHGRNVTPLPPRLTRLDWDTKLRDLLPGQWAMQDDWAERKLSLRDGFSHLSGLARHDFSYTPNDTSVGVIHRLKYLSPGFEMRQQWHYNNHPFMVGAHIIAALANTSYPAFVTSRVFEPLGMTSSTFSPSSAIETGRLTQSWTRNMRRIPFVFSDEAAAVFAGAGGIISNTEDMTKWLTVLLNGGVDPHTNKTIIPPSVLAEMTTARAIVSGVSTGPLSIMGYGMGWFRVSYRGHDVVWHFGAVPGFSTLVAFLPADNLGAVLLANTDEKQDENLNILFRLIDEAFDLPPLRAAERSGFSVRKILEQDVPHDPIDHDEIHMDLGSFAGTYEDPAYGTITLCTSSSVSAHCSRVLADFAPFENASPSSPPHAAALFASLPRVWSSHMHLTPRRVGSDSASSTSFDARFPRLFPEGYGRDTTPFEYWDSLMSTGRAEFVVGTGGAVEGFALITDELAASARAAKGVNVREVGDAWFAQVSGM